MGQEYTKSQQGAQSATFAYPRLPFVPCEGLSQHVQVGAIRWQAPSVCFKVQLCNKYQGSYDGFTKTMSNQPRSPLSMCRGWRPWSSLCTHGSPVIIWWLCISSSGETRKCDLLSQIWPWRARSVATQNNRYLNQAILHLWTKFADFSLNGWWVMVRTSSKWGKFWLLSKIWPWRSRLISPKTIGTLTKVFCIFGSNLVILAGMGPELSRGQASDWYTDTRTHRQRQREYPKAKTVLG